jgi:hypothetical protein
MANNFQYPTIETFTRGINQSQDKQLISFNEAHEACNCDIDDGVLRRSKGAAPCAAPFGISINRLMKHFSSNLGKVILSTNDSIYSVFPLVKLTGGFTNGNFDYINYQIKDTEITILTNGVDNVKVYDGKSFCDLKYNGKDSAISDINKAPKGKFIELHKERVWITGSSDSPNSLYFATPFDPDDWTAPIDADNIETNQHGGEIQIPTWDGGKIIGIKTLFDDIVIFKTKNVHRLFGTYPGNYSIVQIFNTIEGEIVDKSVGSVNNKVFWFTTEGFHCFNGNEVIDLTPQIKEIFSRFSKQEKLSATAIAYKKKYYCAIGDTVIEYNTETGSIMIRKGMTIRDWVEVDNVLYCTTGNHIFVYNDGDTYGGAKIQSYWNTGDTTFGAKNAIKTNEYVYFTGSGNGVVRIWCITDRKSVYKDIMLSSNLREFKVRLKNKGRLFSYRIENVDGADFTIKQPEFIIEYEYD